MKIPVSFSMNPSQYPQRVDFGVERIQKIIPKSEILRLVEFKAFEQVFSRQLKNF